MAVTKGYWGIDIGQCALKALRLEMIDGKPTATAFDYVEHEDPFATRRGPGHPDPRGARKVPLPQQCQDRRRGHRHRRAVGPGTVRQAAAGRRKEDRRDRKIRGEAADPFPLDEVEWDFQKIGGGEAIDGFALETEIGLFAMKRDVISRYLGYFTGSKIEVHLIQMSPLALVNFATYELLKPKAEEGADAEEDPTPRGKKRCTVVMDVGTDASNLIITDGAKIIWQRPIPLGGMNFTPRSRRN
ncbi:pilus assembly protein PilM [Gemmata sp. G18]|uniref:Pilus assembly protein PilM n=1 Tax=Gemmata palustris TaxID=2822762 RepID=A0ABS5BWB7_9BACT|nr:pilus assembly protein PilM [Gemmata palustris]MBP3958029.1 pilus assembly protein PilM [Gemmata palustris]